MSIANYGFVPWVRRGISNKLSSVSNTPGRVTIQVDATLSNAPSSPISKPVQLIGPGDILGINPNVIMRSEPRDGVYDFESNYLAFVEFFEEDFIWRYTPDIPDGQKIKPWLALVVLKDDEFTVKPPAADGLPGAIEINHDKLKTEIFHAFSEHWAWGHVHVNKPRGTSSTTYKDNLNADLKTDPNVAFCRLMCPRRLELNTQYTAFIIPAYETGRMAGLGLDFSSVNKLTPSFDAASSSWGSANVQFPVYHQWRFGTAALGDFETLARALKPLVAEADWSGQPMDISNSGLGLNSLFTGTSPAMTNSNVFLEGALITPQYAESTAFDEGYIKDASSNTNSTNAYVSGLKTILNMSYNLSKHPSSGSSFYASNSTVKNPYSNTVIQDDPLIVPPMYGQWHADVKLVDTSAPTWFQQVNLDIRYRAAAGLGSQVIKDRQEELMEIAWKQIGEVSAINDKIAKGEFAKEISKGIFGKHVLAANASSATSTVDRVNNAIKFGGPILKRTQMTDPLNSSNVITAKTMTAISSMTQNPADGAFRKITRNRSNVVEKMGSATVNSNLIANLDSHINDCTAAKNVVHPTATVNLAAVTQNATSSNTSSYSSLSSMAIPNFKNVYYRQCYELYLTLKFYDQNEKPFNIAPVTLTESTLPSVSGYSSVVYKGSDFVNDFFAAIDPETSITDRIKKMIQLQLGSSISNITDLKPIMAYPVFDEPTYDDLIRLSPDYLLPNPEKYTNNSVTLLETNQRFIESFLIGLNHEFSRELLWREYPTDQRGSYFRRFWDINDTIDLTNSTTNFDYLYDIDPIHTWTDANNIGENHKSRHGDASSRLVLLVKGDLLKKYPNTLIYLQAATGTSAPRSLNTGSSDATDPDYFRFPIFKANLQPDITLIGFNISADEAKGGGSDPGWFVVFRERPGQINFGLDEPNPPTGSKDTTLPSHWNDLTWENIDGDAKKIVVGAITDTTSRDNAVWARSSADMASILYQSPAMVAIHADDMIHT